MPDGLVCWKCGESLDELPQPLARLAECPACRADVHVCRMCEFFDTRVARSCREPVAEDVQDKERANFCGYFKPRPAAYRAADDSEARRSKSALTELFGMQPSGEDSGPESPADAARREWEALFGLGQKKDP